MLLCYCSANKVGKHCCSDVGAVSCRCRGSRKHAARRVGR